MLQFPQEPDEQVPDGWISVADAAKILGVGPRVVYNRHAAKTNPAAWGPEIFRQFAHPGSRGGKRYSFHEARLRGWMRDNPRDAAAYAQSRAPGQKKKKKKKKKKPEKKKPEKKRPKKTQSSKAGGLFVDRGACMRAMTVAIHRIDDTDKSLNTQKLGSVFYDVLVVQATTCCNDAAKKIIDDERFKIVYQQSRFCPLCGQKLKGQ